MSSRSYATPQAFRQALERRLRTVAASGADFERRRQLLVFERFLARVTQVEPETAVLKGGLVLEFRLTRARTTRDVDLLMAGSPNDALDTLQKAGRLDLGDFMRFEVRSDPEHPDIRNEGARYGGQRFRAECRLAGLPYGRAFGVDVAFGGPLAGEPDLIVANDHLAFIDVAPPRIRLLPVVTHVAEKLHAYTLPRERPNTRVRDLPDLALLATVAPLPQKALRSALDQTFQHRGTHSLPEALPAPPEFWSSPYSAMATEEDLPWKTLDAVATAVRSFLNPLLGNSRVESWSPQLWEWK